MTELLVISLFAVPLIHPAVRRVLRGLFHSYVARSNFPGIEAEHRAALAAWDREVAISEGKVVHGDTGSPQNRYEWKKIGGVLHEWKLLDNESGVYVAGIWGHMEVWHYDGKQYDSLQRAQTAAEKRFK